jgi:hypothetical protein
MIHSHRLLALAALSSTLAACAGPAIPYSTAPRPGITPPSTPTVVRPVQQNSLIGSNADAVGRMFGKPRLDVNEGSARKLQFAGTACILDIYFYPARTGAEPVATHVDARTPDGRNADVNSCAAALRR